MAEFSSSPALLSFPGVFTGSLFAGVAAAAAGGATVGGGKIAISPFRGRQWMP